MSLRDRQYFITGYGGSLGRAHRLNDVVPDDDVLPYPEFDDPLDAAKAELRERFPDAPDSLIDTIAPDYLQQGYLDADIRNLLNDGDYEAAEIELGLRQAAAEAFATPEAFRVWPKGDDNDWDRSFIKKGIEWSRFIDRLQKTLPAAQMVANTLRPGAKGPPADPEVVARQRAKQEAARRAHNEAEARLREEMRKFRSAHFPRPENEITTTTIAPDRRTGPEDEVPVERDTLAGYAALGRAMRDATQAPIGFDSRSVELGDGWADFTGGNRLGTLLGFDPRSVKLGPGEVISYATGEVTPAAVTSPLFSFDIYGSRPDVEQSADREPKPAPPDTSWGLPGWDDILSIPGMIGGALSTFVGGSPAQAQEVRQRQKQMASIRRQPISGKLETVLDYAAKAAGVDVEIFSGGQRGIDQKGGGRRTGSRRHDYGNAADLDLKDPKTGRKLSFGRKADRKRIASFIEAASAAGATGIGAGNEYMGDGRLHVGFDNVSSRKGVARSPRTWGSEFRAGGTFQRAFDRGRKNRVDPARATQVAKATRGSDFDPLQAIVDVEARRDSKGRIRSYSLPGNDGGGSYEVAGINERYHPKKAKRLRSLIRSGKHDQAEREAKEYIGEYTSSAARLSDNPGVQLVARDIAFNRGPGGLNASVRLALGKSPTSKKQAWKSLTAKEREEFSRMAERDPEAAIDALTDARATYESKYVGVRPNLIRGLRNRWSKIRDTAVANAQPRTTRVASVDPRAGAFGLGASRSRQNPAATDPGLIVRAARTAQTPFYGTPYATRFATFGDGTTSGSLPITSTAPAIVQPYALSPSGPSVDTKDVLAEMVPGGVPDVENDVAMPGAPINDLQAMGELTEAAPISAPRDGTDVEANLPAGRVAGLSEATTIGYGSPSPDFESNLPAGPITGLTSPATTATTASRGPSVSARSAQSMPMDTLGAYTELGRSAADANARSMLANTPSSYTTSGQVVENLDHYGFISGTEQTPRGGTVSFFGIGVPQSFEQDHQLEAASRPDYDRATGRSASYDADRRAAQGGRAFGTYSGQTYPGVDSNPVADAAASARSAASQFSGAPFGSVGPNNSNMPDMPTDFEQEHGVGTRTGFAAPDRRTSPEDEVPVPDALEFYASLGANVAPSFNNALGRARNADLMASVDAAMDSLQIGSFAAPPNTLSPTVSVPALDSVSSTLGTRTPIGFGVIDVDMGPLSTEPTTFNRGTSQPLGPTISDRELDNLNAIQAGGVGRFAVPQLSMPSVSPRTVSAFGAKGIPGLTNMSGPAALSSYQRAGYAPSMGALSGFALSPSIGFDAARERAQDVSPIGGNYNASSPTGSFNHSSSAIDGSFGADSFNNASVFDGYHGIDTSAGSFGGFGDTGVSYGGSDGAGLGGSWDSWGGDPFGGDVWGGGGDTAFGGWDSGGGWNDGGWGDSGVAGTSLGSSNIGDTGGRASSSGGFANTGVSYGGDRGAGLVGGSRSLGNSDFNNADYSYGSRGLSNGGRSQQAIDAAKAVDAMDGHGSSVGDDSQSADKIVCTAMGKAYGFGSFRNAIWLKYAADNLTLDHQAGYHAIFLPLVRYGYGGDGIGRRVVRGALEHIARHRTADLWKMKKGRRDRLGRVYRSVLEPLCFAVGWLKRNAGI